LVTIIGRLPVALNPSMSPAPTGRTEMGRRLLFVALGDHEVLITGHEGMRARE
jgi:hypothetical protein